MATLEDKLAATEYTELRSTGKLYDTDFGTFVADDRYLGIHGACLLTDAMMPNNGSLEEFDEALEDLYRSHPRLFRKVTMHRKDASESPGAHLSARGFNVSEMLCMILREKPQLSASSSIQIRQLSNDGDWDDYRAIATACDTWGHPPLTDLRIECYLKLNASIFIAYLDNRPVGSTGFFVVDDVSRNCQVETIPQARRKGVATSLILTVQSHVASQNIEHLSIFVSPELDAHRLYLRLGYREV